MNAYYTVVPTCLLLDNDLTPGTRLIYGAIASLCFDGPSCQPTNQELADMFNIDARTAQRCIRALEEKGYLAIDDNETRTISLSTGMTVAPPLNDNRKTVRDDAPAPPKDAFEQFWAVYPKKKWKPEAKKAWEARSKKPGFPDLTTLIGALEQWKRTDEWLKDGGQFIPGAGKWLRNDGWNNELPASSDAVLEAKKKQLREASRG